jgi:hypothetical protein
LLSQSVKGFCQGSGRGDRHASTAAAGANHLEMEKGKELLVMAMRQHQKKKA